MTRLLLPSPKAFVVVTEILWEATMASRDVFIVPLSRSPRPPDRSTRTLLAVARHQAASSWPRTAPPGKSAVCTFT